MARTCTREATVYVWRFLGPKHPGHAAVKLTGLPNGEKVYISWWPRGGAGKSSAHETKGGRAHHTYKRDMYSETGENTRTLLDLDPRLARTNHRQVLVHFEGADGITFGLDLVWMAAWWEIFTAAPHPVHKYASKYKNCSGVAAAAPRVGGADQYATPPSAMFFIDPNQIGRWARSIKTELERRNEAAEAIIHDIVAAGENPLVQVADLMTPTEWTTFSNRDMRGAKLRSEKVQEMDRLVRQYHAYRWSAGMAPTKLRLLAELMDVIHYYLGRKAGSKRGDAVLGLGQQVLAVARAKAVEYATNLSAIKDQLSWTEREMGAT